MKKLITLTLSIILTMSAFGQRLEYERSSKWFFGLNAGATWNTTDVQNKTHAGWGFMLGRSFNYDYGRRLSYDLRMRYLRGKWYGQDTDSTNLSHLGADYSGALSQYKEGLGYTVNNYEANVHELGLELAIHFNRLRDRSGWDPYIFGGVNVVWNETYGNLLSQAVFLAPDSATYEYNTIDMTKPAIEGLLDDNYESALDGTTNGRFNANFMPSLGFGIGYDFGPRFSMGLEHKTTFALKDDFDGYVDAEPNWGFLKNDVHHYTSAYLRWRFRTGGGRTRPTPTPNPNRPITTGGTSTTPPCQFPDVRTTRPLQRTETVQAQQYIYRAEVRFVQSRNQIVMRVNGIETTNFLYNHDTHELEAYLFLQPGNNTIEVTGRNACGTDSETSTLIFNDCIDPIVYFENVCGNTQTAQVEQRSYTVQAQISNATNIEFTVNGVRSTNFIYNSATGQFSSNILLNEGQNTIRITAINGCGTDTGTSVVTFTDCADPLVNFANGNSGFVSVSQANFDLSAYVYNMTNSNGVSLRLNGSSRNFNFNNNTGLLTAALVLNPGQNTIQITATNNCGADTETLTIDYTPCVNPSIQMVQPLTQSSVSANGIQAVKAMLYNVANINQVQLLVNGNLQQGGSYNSITKLFEANVALNSGFNTIQIIVLNDCGSDTETLSVNYDPCNTPDAQLILPSSNGGLVASPSQLVQAMVFNVNNINEIQTFVNGNLQNGGTYNNVNGLYQITVGLTLGLNTIQVVATNGCGSDVQTVTITYRACEAPVITFTAPAGTPFFTTATNLNVSAMIAGITNTSQVQLKVNGVIDASGASYNGTSLAYNNNVNLTAGNNVINITATNNCGTVTKEINVIREVVVVTTPNDVDSIVICFVHSNNVGNPETMTIPLSQWPSYQSQGAQLGACPVVVDPIDLPMTICYRVNGALTTMQILTSEWPAYQALGATEGSCREETKVICFNGNQLSVLVSQWPSYQSQGATEGPCPIQQEETIIICHTTPGDPAITEELEIPLSQWPSYQSQGAQLGPCPVDPDMTICFLDNGVRTTMTILTSEWPLYQSQGATQGPCPVVPDPEITICMDVNGVPTTMTILTSEWASYQAQGATMGACIAVADPSIQICVGGVGMTILTSQWPAYEMEGATLGPCPVADPDMVICLKETEMTIPTSQWPTYQAQGATQGPCPGGVTDSMITICHKPPGNPTNTQQLEIPLSAWAAHQAHGDVLGPCPTPDPDMTICLNGTELTILTSEWATYQAQGATQGPCVVVPETMTVCLNGQQLEIPVSEWPGYASEGAVQGPCVSQTMTICYNAKTLKIQISEWAEYQALGATIGACTVNPNGGSIEINPQGIENGDTLNGNIERPTNGGGNEDELLFGNRTITICHTPNGSIASQTIQIPLSEWEQYQALGATLGQCTGGVQSGGNGKIETKPNGTSNENGVGNVPVNPNGTGGNMPTVGNGSQEATQEALRKQKEEAAKKAAQEKAAQEAEVLRQAEEAKRKAAAEKARQEKAAKVAAEQKAAAEKARLENEAEEAKKKAAAEKARQEKAIKDAAAQKAAKEEAARRQAEDAKRKAAQDAAAAKARQEQAVKDAAAQKAAKEEAARRQAEDAKRKAAQDAAAEKARQEKAIKDAAAQKAAKEAAARRQAEEAKRKAAQNAAAEKARQEKAAKDAAARRQAEEAKRKKAAQEAAAAKARQEKAAREAAARRQAEEAKRKAAAEAKARQEKAAREAAAKKAAAQEAARRKAAQEAAAAKARQEKAARDAAAAKKAAAEKARREKAAKDAAAKKAADAAARKKAEEQRKLKEKEGGR